LAKAIDAYEAGSLVLLYLIFEFLIDFKRSSAVFIRSLTLTKC